MDDINTGFERLAELQVSIQTITASYWILIMAN